MKPLTPSSAAGDASASPSSAPSSVAPSTDRQTQKPATPPMPVGILLAAGRGSRFAAESGARSGAESGAGSGAGFEADASLGTHVAAPNKLLQPLTKGPETGLPVGYVAARRLRNALPRVIAVIDGAPLDEVHAQQQRTLAEWLTRAGCEVVKSANAAQGMAASLADGIRASLGDGLPPPVGWIVALADMPAIAPATIQQISTALTAAVNGAGDGSNGGNADVAADGTTHAMADNGADSLALVAPVYDGRRGHPAGIGSGHLAALLALEGDRGAASLFATRGFTAIDTGDAGVLRDIDVPADLN